MGEKDGYGMKNVDLCDFRNKILVRIRECLPDEKTGLQTALDMIRSQIAYNALNREIKK